MSDVGTSSIEILLIDDSPTDRLIAAEALSHALVASRLHSVDNGVDAMAYLRREGKFSAANRPDLILLDLNLPKKDGREVLREIKQAADLKLIPVIVLTTSAADEDIARAYDDHANSFISKPVDFPRFAQALEAVRKYWFEVVRLPPARGATRSPASEEPRPTPSQAQPSRALALPSDDARVARELRELCDGLSERMDAIGRLSSGIAHDFNNLLTVLQGHAELALELTTDARVRDSVQGISDASERAAQLTRQLLAFSQPQAARFELVDLNRAVSAFAKMLRRALGAEVRLELGLSSRAPLAQADLGLLEQLLIELAIEARVAMPAGGELVLETGCRTLAASSLSHPEARAGAFSTLTLRDTRPSLAEARVPASVLGIVQQHQGWLESESTPGVGRCVEIFLPSAQPERVVARPQPKPAQRGSETVLVVDDESPVRQMAKAVLGRHGYRVIEARSGPDAITRFEEAAGEVALLLTDLVMPGGMTGRELAGALTRRDPRLAVVYTSGYGRNAVAPGWALDEAVNFLPKPYSAARLLTIVRRALDNPDSNGKVEGRED